jgi:hypothetical protein
MVPFWVQSGVGGADSSSLLVSFVFLDTTIAAAAGVATDAAANAVVGASVGGEISSDGADSDTGGIGGADSSSLMVSFVFLGTKIAAAAGAAADAVAGASVGVGISSNDAVSSTKGDGGAGSTLLGLIPVFSFGFFFVISVGLIMLLVGMAMVGLTEILFFIVGEGALRLSPLLGVF